MTRAHDPRLEEIARHLAADDPRLASRMRRVEPWTRGRWRPLRDRVATRLHPKNTALAASLSR